MLKAKLNKKTIVFSLLFILMLIMTPISTYKANANPSAERGVIATDAQVVYPDIEEEPIDIGGIDGLDLILEVIKDKQAEEPILVTKEEVQADLDLIKAEYKEKVIEEGLTIKHFDDDISDVIKQYNDLYREELEKYTKEDFVLNYVFDVEINNELKTLVFDCLDTYVRVRLDFGGSQSAEDPLPIILYRCTKEDEWTHFELVASDSRRQECKTKHLNWAERAEDGKIILNFYHFCPIMVLEPAVPTEPLPTEGCSYIPHWLIIVLLIITAIMISIFKAFDKKNPVTEVEGVASEVVNGVTPENNTQETPAPKSASKKTQVKNANKKPTKKNKKHK